MLGADPAATLDALAARVRRRRRRPGSRRGPQADAAAGAAIDETLGDGLGEPRVARELGALLPADATLFVASSMPVRDVETFLAVRADPPRVLANRGANGIDGTVSAAFGAAAAGDGPVVLLIGDVALAHDLGGLLAARRLGLALTIVLVDNDGGGIFEFLPGRRRGRRVRGARRDADRPRRGARRARCSGSTTRRPAIRGAFAAAVSAALASERTTLIHVRTDRKANVTEHRAVWEAVRARV